MKDHIKKVLAYPLAKFTENNFLQSCIPANNNHCRSLLSFSDNPQCTYFAYNLHNSCLNTEIHRDVLFLASNRLQPLEL
jgi:hypothetical protein